jgi:DNA-binding transcriptional MerR regulator
MDKSPDAFRTISEVAEDLDIPQHVLRFWETRFTQIKPLKRGGGRRYYRPDDVDLLKGIRTLLYGEGYTIRGLQRILKEEGPRYVQSVGRGEINAAPARAEIGDEENPQGFEHEADDFTPVLKQADLEKLHEALEDLVESQRLLQEALAHEDERDQK